MSAKEHIPVLLEETLAFLDASRPGLYIDGTLGLAGHATALLKANPRATLIGFDLDEISLQEAKRRLQAFANRVTLYHADFRYLPDLALDLTSLRGLLLDLGLSSFQLDDAERGFSFNLDGPLDMRRDFRIRLTAAKVLEKYSEPKLAEVFREYGELRQARPLARRIVSARKVRPLETTTELRRIVEDVCRWIPEKGKLHPAAKVFQALRIEVNQELKDLSEFLERTILAAPAGARFVVLSYHSLEDRIIKRTFARLAHPEAGAPLLRPLTKKPVMAGAEEAARNSRARSAKLRAAERV